MLQPDTLLIAVHPETLCGPGGRHEDRLAMIAALRDWTGPLAVIQGEDWKWLEVEPDLSNAIDAALARAGDRGLRMRSDIGGPSGAGWSAKAIRNHVAATLWIAPTQVTVVGKGPLVDRLRQTAASSGIEDSLDADNFEPPKYTDPGAVVFRVFSWDDKNDIEIESLDTRGSAFWIVEGEGVDDWIKEHIESARLGDPGVYVVEGISGHVFRGDGWTTDDRVDWSFETLRRATPEEVAIHDKVRLFNACPDEKEPDWSRFADLEIGGCVENDDPEHPGRKIVDGGQSASVASFFTIYGRTHEGLAEAVTDCARLDIADEVAAELSERAGGLVVRDAMGLDRHGAEPAAPTI